MPVSLNSNLAANQAVLDISFHAARHQAALNQISSGSRFDPLGSSDARNIDTGAMSVATNLRSALSRNSATLQGVANALSYTQAQGAALQHLSGILGEMAEIATQMQDPTKPNADLESYATKFLGLQQEMLDLQSANFNGVYLFSPNASADGNSLSVQIAEDGHRTLSIDKADLTSVQAFQLSQVFTPASYGVNNTGTWGATDISDPSSGASFAAVMDLSIESVAQLLAANGSTQSRLLMAMESLRNGATQIEQAHGQIADTDVAHSSSELSRTNILMDASAMALTQAKELPKTFLGLLNL